ncbi:hypothetical protein [Photobacterium sp. GJ3]|uniref:hypothetical protein n=1 Tax=Photobacterium sp. GJ3 TaxID=2829502 RepID=UPI0035301F1C
MGSGEDWRTCARSLSDFRSIALDLPGHGRSVAVDCDSLNQAATQVADTLSARLPPGSRWCWWAIRSADGLHAWSGGGSVWILTDSAIGD